MATCETGSNISFQKAKAQYGPIVAVWLDKVNTEVTASNALLEATWTTKINAAWASRLFLPINTKQTLVTQGLNEMVKVATNVGTWIKATNGERTYTFDLANLTTCQHNKLKTLDQQSMYGWFIHKNGYISCIKTATGYKPIPVQVFVDEINFGENIEDFIHSKMDIHISPRVDFFTGTIEVVAFDPLNLQGVTNLDLTVVSSSDASGTIVVDVTTECDECSEVTTLTTAGDWIVETTAGVTASPAAMSNVNNRYTLTGLTAILNAGDTFYLYRKTADQATDKGYETRNGSAVEKTSFVCGA